MKQPITSERWAAIRDFCEGETPDVELFAAVSGIDVAVLDERHRQSVERQEDEGAAA